MTKRKKPRGPGIEGSCPKPSKNSRLEEPAGSPQRCKPEPCLIHPEEEPEPDSGPHSQKAGGQEELGETASSSPGEDTDAKLLSQTDSEQGPPPATQNSAGRFVPQFSKSRKMVSRPAELRVAHPGSLTSDLELKPSTVPGEMGSQQDTEAAPGPPAPQGDSQDPQPPLETPYVCPEVVSPPPQQLPDLAAPKELQDAGVGSPGGDASSTQPLETCSGDVVPPDANLGLTKPGQKTPEQGQPPSLVSGGLPVSPTVNPGICQSECRGIPKLEMDLGASQTDEAVCTLILPSVTPNISATDTSPQSLEPKLLGLTLLPGSPAPLLSPEPLDASPGWPELPPDSVDMAAFWGGSPGLELHFPPDSEMGDPPGDSTLEAKEQKQEPKGSSVAPPSQAQPSPLAQTPALEDASETVRGLVVELSNLNRLLMNSQRDLGAFQCLSSRRGSFA